MKQVGTPEMVIGVENPEQITKMTENCRNITSVSGSDSDSDSDDDGASTVHEVDIDCGPRTIDIPAIDASETTTTIVNMTRCSKVQIKPTTKIIGPVTIHQYPNTNSGVGSLDQNAKPRYRLPEVPQNCTVTSTERAELPEESGPQDTLQISRRTICHAMVSSLSWKLGIILTLIVAVIVVAIAIFTALRKDSEESARPGYLWNRSSEEPENDFGDGICMITKKRWGAHEILHNRTLAHPIRFIIIGHTVGGWCTTVETCSRELITIQSFHYEQGFGDVKYNFLVGGDGNIYEGLGWDIQNPLYNNSVWISFMGNYVFRHLNERQLKGMQLLIDRGINLGKLDKDYWLTAHNQFASTMSPGKFILEAMKTWPHYNNRTFA